MLQAIGSSRFALYHHIIRRRIDVSLSAGHRDAFSRELDQMLAGAARGQAALRQRSVPDPDPPPAAGPGRRRSTGWRDVSAGRRPRRDAGAAYEAAPARRRPRRAARRARQLCAAAARRLRDARRGRARSRSNSSPRSTMARCARCCCRCRISAPICPIAGSASARRRSSSGRAANLERGFVGMVSIKDYPGPDRARHARRAAAPAVRADRLAELRLRRPAGGAVGG